MTLTTATINAAIQATVDSGGGIVDIGPGVYDPFPGGTLTKIVGASNVTLRGSGRGATIIRIPDQVVFQDYLIDGYGCNKFYVYDLTLDMGNIDPLDDGESGAHPSGAIHFGYNANLQAGGFYNAVERCEIVNHGRYGIVVHDGSRGLVLRGNKFERSAPLNGEDSGGRSNVAMLLRPHAGPHVHAIIDANESVNLCGIAASVLKSHITNNVIRRSGYGANIAIEDDSGCAGNVIEGNIVADSTAVIPTHTPHGMEIWGTNNLVVGNRAEGNAGCGIAICGSGGTTAIGNQSYSNGQDGFYVHPTAGPGISFLANRSRGNGLTPLNPNGVTVTSTGNDFA